MRRHLLALPAVALALAFAACGDDEPEESAATPAATEEVTEAPTEAPTEEAPAPEAGEAPSSGDSGVKVEGKVGEKPEIDTSGAKETTELIVEDIEEGDGAEAKSGDTVSVQYSGVLADGTAFDNSFDRGQPFDFQLGAGMVIPGWDQGVAGMKEGGRRVLVIPSDLGYGDAGSPPTIPGGATLVFVVDLEKVNP
jgi:peptidylprolyl isomerase